MQAEKEKVEQQRDDDDRNSIRVEVYYFDPRNGGTRADRALNVRVSCASCACV